MKQPTPTSARIIATEVLLPGLVEPSGLQIRERTLSAPRPGEALVQVETTGISLPNKRCGTVDILRSPPLLSFPGTTWWDVSLT